MIPLAPGDPVCVCVNTMAQLLQLLPVECLLTNGKIEKQLKFFLGAAWEQGQPKTRAYVMDKRPFDGFELDLLAFDNCVPQFWIEAKSSFKDDWNDVTRSARKALRQAEARINSDALRPQNCDGYIVHFLTSLPDVATKIPRFMMDAFDALRNTPPSNLDQRAYELETLYRAEAAVHYNSSESIRLWPVDRKFDPTVFAVVVKLNQRP